MSVGFPRHWARGLRDGQGFTREQCATRGGFSAESVKKWEKGWVQPSEPLLIALADALGVHPDEFKRPEGDPTSEYIAGVLYRARPLTDAELDAAALVLRRARAERRETEGAS